MTKSCELAGSVFLYISTHIGTAVRIQGLVLLDEASMRFFFFLSNIDKI